MIAGAGLVDGVNPCAISTLVFFMSLLAMAKVRGRGLLAMGLAFCLASFVTYLAIGFGLLRGLHMLRGFPLVQDGLRVAMLGLLLVLAFLSFRDAWRFARSGRPSDVTLQLPDRIKTRMHASMKRGLGFGSLALGGLVIGSLVTAIESVCTGQVYVPTLVLVARTGGPAGKAWGCLLLYNATTPCSSFPWRRSSSWPSSACGPRRSLPGASGRSWPARSSWAGSSSPWPR